MCFGDTVLPIITIPAMTKFGMYAYLNFLALRNANAIKDASSEKDCIMNFGSPIGIPNAPTTDIAPNTMTSDF